MADLRISGYWKDTTGAITHYAVHVMYERTIAKAQKLSKEELIRLVDNAGNTAFTWVWDYDTNFWRDAERVTVARHGLKKILRCHANNSNKDDLAHLINFDWI